MFGVRKKGGGGGLFGLGVKDYLVWGVSPTKSQ